MQTTRTFTDLCQRHQLFFNEAIILSRSWNIINEHIAVTGDGTLLAEGYRWGNTIPGHNTLNCQHFKRQLISRHWWAALAHVLGAVELCSCQWESCALLLWRMSQRKWTTCAMAQRLDRADMDRKIREFHPASTLI